MVETFIPAGLGWQRDLPDPRDCVPDRPEVTKLLRDLRPGGNTFPQVDWREFTGPAKDQGTLDASCAFAALGLFCDLERRAHGRVSEPSHLFVHQTARRLAVETDGCVGLRATWKALARFGFPPERCWPYDEDRVTLDPDAFAHGFADEFHQARYVRLDGGDTSATLHATKSFLAAGFPSAFGFSVFASLTQDPDVSLPTKNDGLRGGQAVVAVGYDDKRRIGSDRGALLIRSSWGQGWGDAGHGWLPYGYVLNGLAADFWTLIRKDWVASGEFTRPSGT